MVVEEEEEMIEIHLEVMEVLPMIHQVMAVINAEKMGTLLENVQMLHKLVTRNVSSVER